MEIKAIIFDVYGTLVDIWTNEENEEIYRTISRFLSYQGVYVRREDVRDGYFQIMRELKATGGEKYPEFDVIDLWRNFLKRHAGEYTRIMHPEKLKWMPTVLAEIFRAVSRERLKLYPDVGDVLNELRIRYKLAAVSDAQGVWVLPELRALGLANFFNPLIVSGDLGYRKPDERMFAAALSKLKLKPDNVIFVGNDMFHDVFGAKSAGIKTVYFSSNQGAKQHEGTEPDYIIYEFSELRQAIAFLENS